VKILPRKRVVLKICTSRGQDSLENIPQEQDDLKNMYFPKIGICGKYLPGVKDNLENTP
jgi:hypothetical protein